MDVRLGSPSHIQIEHISEKSYFRELSHSYAIFTLGLRVDVLWRSARQDRSKPLSSGGSGAASPA
jgi:hypothetical protein